ncbi:MAG: MopE-related protein [Myxococcota bacterium]
MTLLLALAGCLFVTEADYLAQVDLDGDGHVGPAFGGLDCAEGDPSIHPGAPDIPYDGIDSDCDGSNDFDQDGDGLLAAEYGGTDCDDTDVELGEQRFPWYADCDGDGAFSDTLELGCTAPTDQLVCDGAAAASWSSTRPDVFDCDDRIATTFPGNPNDVPYDGIDADCDGQNDFDVDGDGYVSAAIPGAVPSADAPLSGDCNDTDPQIHPGAAEVWYDGIDQDCDGANDYDRDGDTFVRTGDNGEAGGTAPRIGDCDDGDALVNPGVDEVWYDGVDADCSGTNDWDADGDGAVAPEHAAFAPGLPPTDCDDDDPTKSPFATEIPYDGIDSDCSALDGIAGNDNDYDADGDGFVALGYEGFAGDLQTGDCDDTSAIAYPRPPEEEVFYDGIDGACDGGNDWDADGDGFDAAHEGVPAALVDCDDTRPFVNPLGFENFYDGIDGDCDGLDDYDADGDGSVSFQWAAESDLPAVDCDDDDPERSGLLDEIWYDGIDRDCQFDNDYDQDHDNHVATLFEAFSGNLATGDCDDTDATVNPNAFETWYDGIDQDCDGANDYDRDGDNVVSDAFPGTSGGTAPYEGDCLDTSPVVSPLAQEVWYDGVDEDCDGANDYDQDRDGYVWEQYPGQSGGTAPGELDCRDTDATFNPGVPEVWYDIVDQNCDGANDFDADGDGFVAANFPEAASASAPGVGDCDDFEAAVNPGQTEVYYDGVDADCDGVNDWDQDEDGFVATAYNAFAGGSAPNVDDCDDLEVTSHPGAFEVWYNGIDEDCDGQDDDQDGDGFGVMSDCDDLDAARHSQGRVLAVGEDLQAALGLACAGESFTLAPGTHVLAAPLVLADPVSLTGYGASLSASGARTLEVSGGGVELAGMTLTGGTATDGGCALVTGDATFETVTFQGCTATARGGALFVASGGAAELGMCTFTGNTADRGGDAAVTAGGALDLADSTLSLGSATTGGSLYADGGGLTAWSTQITGASATSGGGLYAVDAAVSLQSTTFSATSALGTGGALQMVGGDLALEGVTVSGATASTTRTGPAQPQPALIALVDAGADGSVALEGVTVSGGAAAAGIDIDEARAFVWLDSVTVDSASIGTGLAVRMGGASQGTVHARRLLLVDGQASLWVDVTDAGSSAFLENVTAVSTGPEATVDLRQQPGYVSFTNGLVENLADGVGVAYRSEDGLGYRVRYTHTVGGATWASTQASLPSTGVPAACAGCSENAGTCFTPAWTACSPIATLPGDPDLCLGEPSCTAVPGFTGGVY